MAAACRCVRWDRGQAPGRACWRQRVTAEQAAWIQLRQGWPELSASCQLIGSQPGLHVSACVSVRRACAGSRAPYPLSGAARAWLGLRLCGLSTAGKSNDGSAQVHRAPAAAVNVCKAAGLGGSECPQHWHGQRAVYREHSSGPPGLQADMTPLQIVRSGTRSLTSSLEALDLIALFQKL